MYRSCPVCGLTYEREEGYFLGAMYVSYGLALVVLFAVMLPLWLVVGVTLTRAVLVAFLVFLPLVPLLSVYARVLWIHFDQGLDPERS